MEELTITGEAKGFKGGERDVGIGLPAPPTGVNLNDIGALNVLCCECPFKLSPEELLCMGTAKPLLLDLAWLFTRFDNAKELAVGVARGDELGGWITVLRKPMR